ncbi:MAG: alanine--glyoxylate aminotransferase family protein [Chloroflexi bacterium]|jgi:aspartate aminotransferase-like enzyme|nr:MAG: alanine--glyoxylate aminotransferase family protein [Chloroflexota bacterium]
MSDTPNLRIPGPTPVPPDILEAVAHPMVNHRGREFAALISRVAERLKDWFQTSNDVLILSASGTGGLESAVVSTLSPRDRVLSVSIGAFGERFAAIADTYGAEVIPLQYEWGQAARAEDVRQALAEHPDVKAVLVTHNETSTGVTNPLEEIARAIRSQESGVRSQGPSRASGRTDGPLVLVDAVSSLGAIPFEADGWGLDVVVTGSQKGWMVPPGLAFVSMSERAWRAYENAKMPRFYLDLGRHRDALPKGQTPWTPAMSIFFGLDVALERMAEEGAERIFTRHASMGRMVREGVKAFGLELLCQDERYASDTVTAIKCPEGVEVSALRNTMEDEYNVVIAGGQGKLQGKIFRIGHLGLVEEEDIRETLAALEQTLAKLGFAVRAAR